MKKSSTWKKSGIWALAFLFSFHFLSARENNRLVFKDGAAAITLEDPIGHPFYWWPETLLSYEVTSDVALSETNLCLVDRKSGKQMPFQLVRTPEAKTAVLYLMSGLPSKGACAFTLQKGEPEQFKPVQLEKDDRWITVTTGRFSVRIPSSRANPSGEIPGPVGSISKDKINWLGHSFFNAGKATLKKLETKQLSAGPLFAAFELTYLFSDGAEYKAWVRCVEGYDFVEVKEQMTGFANDSRSGWYMEWSGFSPTRRQAPNHPYGSPKPDGTGFNRYDWERIDQTMLNSHHGINKEVSPDGKIPFELGIFGNWPAETNQTSSVFWDERTDQSVGLFVKDISFWNDRQYAIWHDTRIMSVKFYYKDALLKWLFPVVNGTRSTAVSFYPHQKDVRYMDELETLTKPTRNPDGTSYSAKMSQLSYNSFLQNKHSTLDLNVVKDWCLTYPETAVIPEPVFDKKRKGNVHDFEQSFFYGGFSNELAISGPCQNSGYGPTASRAFYENYTSKLNLLLPEMTKDQRERMIAMFLVHAYIAAGEEYMPMRNMLSGHPNFLSDVKSVPAFAAYLFPEHPEAQAWADLFEKYIELNSHYHTRPAVRSWDATGGRWTENINTYIWGFIRPAIRANYALSLMDGKKRMASKEMTLIGDYVMNALSAPFDGGTFEASDKHNWGAVTPANAPARVIPPLGAHAVRRMLPSAYWLLGKEFENYDPLLSENMRYIARPEYQDAEMMVRDDNVFNCMYPLDTDDSGTPPQLESVKITGYGIVLRAAVGTKDELSVHLEQIDNGPNYRWGIVGDGGCGSVYFYAAGKSYSDNGKEDAGDRRLQDTDLTTNFGVFKEGRFKSIGKNELTEPMYDLGVGQFAEIRSAASRKYAWPEYQGRSVMLVGSDYFLLYDDVYNQNMGSRFSWFTKPDESLPELAVIKGGGADYTYSKQKTECITHSGRESKGVWFDGTGDFLTFVSHKKGYEQQPKPYGCVIRSPEGNTDYLFRNDLPVEVNEGGNLFAGTAGFIRLLPDRKELAIFHGSRIGVGGFEIQPHHSAAGLSAVVKDTENVEGQFYCMEQADVTFKWEKGLPSALNVYVDGVKQQGVVGGNEITVTIPAGKHVWNISKGLPALLKPRIEYTRNDKQKVEVAAAPVPGATGYRFEYSTDAGRTWTAVKEQPQYKRTFLPQSGERKGYIRVTAVNREHESAPSVIYPVYYTSAKPHFPDGLKLVTDDDRVDLTWGKVLGCHQYKLYKKAGNGAWKLLYSGNGNRFADKQYVKDALYEYAVSAVNGNGESLRSNPVTTDPDSWLNFTPVKGEPFRRVIGKENPVDNEGNDTPSYYPE
jgi:hypothetical protein